MVTSQNCPDDETLAAFAEGRLAPEAIQNILSHLDTCITCREITAANMAFLEVEASSAAAPPNLIPFPGPARRLVWTALPLAAVIILGLLFFFNDPSSRQFNDIQLLAQAEMDHFARNGSPLVDRFRLSLIPDEAIEANPKRSSNSLTQSRDPETIQRLAQIKPNTDPYRLAGLHLIALKIMAGELNSALKKASELKAAFPQDADVLSHEVLARYLLAADLQRDVEIHKAIEDLEALHLRFPKHWDIAYNLGTLYFENQRKEEAEQIWDAYQKQNPRDRFSKRIQQLKMP